MLTAFIKFGDGTISTDTADATLSRALRDPAARFWLDIQSPTEDEYAVLDDVFGFHPLAIEDTMLYQQRPKLESYNHVGDALKQGYFYLVMHGPDLATFKEKVQTRELDIFVSERYIVTVHDEALKAVTEQVTRARSDPAHALDIGIDRILYALLDRTVDNYLPILDYLREQIEEVEDQVAEEANPDLLVKITQYKRDLLSLRRIIGPQREVMAMLTRGEVPFIRETTRIYLRDVLDHLIRAVETVELYRELILGARELYLTSINTNLNRVMKTLTIITVLALPVNMITGFFGMNFAHTSIESGAVFWTVVALMVTVLLLLLALFRRIRWI